MHRATAQGCRAMILVLCLFACAGKGVSTMQANGVIFANSGQGLGGETGNDVALGDLDGDGDLDAFVANDYSEFGEANQIWLNNGNGQFVAGATLGTNDGHAVALGDLDGDGDLDALVAGDTSGQVWLNQGGAQGGSPGSFSAGALLDSAIAYGVALGDVDGDGDLDALLVGNSNGIWLNDGNGAYSPGPTFPFLFSEDALLVDLDGDGRRDAVIVDSGDGSDSRVWWNDGNWTPGPGSFTPGPLLPLDQLVHSVAAGDVDGDGRPDLFLAGSGADAIFWNEGGRTFSPAALLAADDNSFDVVLGDVDGDDDLDAVVANISAEPNRVWRNDGERALTVAQEFGDEAGLYWSRGLGLGDLNGDSALDLFEVTTADDRVWFNRQPAAVVPNGEGWQIELLAARGDTGQLPVLALDADGYPHIAYVSTIITGYDETEGSYIDAFNLYYGRWDGVGWQTEVVRSRLDAVDSIALAVDGDGEPHLAYIGGELAQYPTYARRTAGVWQESALPDAGAYVNEVSLALDAAGNPHITYTAQTGQLVHTSGDGEGWQSEIVDVGIRYTPNSAAVDATGSVHVAYLSCPSGEEECQPSEVLLKYARRTGGTWQREIIDGQVYPYNALVLDGEGRPHIAYHTFGPYAPTLFHAYWDGEGWQHEAILDPGSGAAALSLDVDSAGNAHLFFVSDRFDGVFFQYVRPEGTGWRVETLDHSDGDSDTAAHLAMALDGDDALHAVYYDPRFGDLRYVTWAPNWQIRALPEAGIVQAPAMAIYDRPVGSITPSIAYYNQRSGQVKTATWEDGWAVNPVAFVAEQGTDVSVAVDAGGEQVSYYDAGNRRLIYSRWDGVAWHPQVVDESGDVGRYNSLVLAGSTPRIAYWDATVRQIKLAMPAGEALLWNIYPNLAAPPLAAGSGPLSSAALAGGDHAISYYDAGNGDLRLATWHRGTESWTDELVDGTGADVGRLNAIWVDAIDAIPVLAYLDETAGAIKMAYKMDGSWQRQTVVTEAGITGLSLTLGMHSRERARIAYTTGAGALRVAVYQEGRWHIEEVVAAGGGALSEVTSGQDVRPHLAYTAGSGGLYYAFRSAALDRDTSDPGPLPPAWFTSGPYNPLDACLAALHFPEEEHLAAGRGADLASQLPPLGQGAGDDAIFDALHLLFTTSPSGRAYIAQYGRHGAEMGRIGLDDPALLWDGFGVLQNFLPGLEALVSGHGDEVVVTQQMVDDALDIWQRLAAAGSPSLAAAINAELTRYDNLQAFVGMTFGEWAAALGIPAYRSYMPVVAHSG